MSETAYLKPLPQTDGVDRPYWEGTRVGELRLQRCGNCGKYRFPANRWCPACRSDRSEWVATSGKGAIWSWCVFHKGYFEGFELPYAVVLVELDEGVRMYSNIVDVAPADLRVGMRVRAVFDKATDAVTLVKFARDTDAPEGGAS